MGIPITEQRVVGVSMAHLYRLVLLSLALQMLLAGCATVRPFTPPESVYVGVENTSRKVFVISFDRDGYEVPAAEGDLLSDRIKKMMSETGAPGIFVNIYCHGWQYDFTAAIEENQQWMQACILHTLDLPALEERYSNYKLISIYMHWPSASRSFLSFWYMKNRARLVGKRGAAMLLRKLQDAAPPGRKVSFTLMGHSLGALVVSEMLLNSRDGDGEVKPVDSLILIQGAVPLWAYCSRIPEPRRTYKNLEKDPGPGYYWPIVRDGMVQGPIVVVYSEHDKVLRSWFGLANNDRGQQPKESRDRPPYGKGPNVKTTKYPTFGAVGGFGARGPIPRRHDMLLLEADKPYNFRRGHFYNLDGSRFIKSHMGFAIPEVAHIIYQVALAGQDSPPEDVR